MKIGYLGAGIWGTALSNLLAKQLHEVKVWDRNLDLIKILEEKNEHPKLPGVLLSDKIKYVYSLEEAISDADIIVESVTSNGIRAVLDLIYLKRKSNMCPVVLTSKGIEQNTGLLFPELALQIFGEENRNKIACLSGPSLANEVIQNYPTSVVSASFDSNLARYVSDIFNTANFRVYPNTDILGVCFGGAMKNIIAIACAICDGLELGGNTKAALMTRGLHEIRKLAQAKGCDQNTLNGLSGLGDLFVTCSSTLSRNYRFGQLIAQGYTIDQAKETIGMVVEGAYTCVSARELGRKLNVPLPITESTYKILYEGMSVKEAISILLSRVIKPEHL